MKLLLMLSMLAMIHEQVNQKALNTAQNTSL